MATEPVPTNNRSLQLDRAALDRVLGRAAELHAGHSEPMERMTEAQLIALGNEVGIAPEHIRQAIAEERTRVPSASDGANGTIDNLFGAAAISATRVIVGDSKVLLERLDDWMQREELLRQRRRFPDRITWERRSDFAVEIKAGFNLSGRAYSLRQAHEVAATIVPIDASSVLVRLDADFSDTRRNASWIGAGMAATGVLVAAGLLAAVSYLPGGSVLVAGGAGAGTSLAGLGAGALVARHQRKRLERARFGLELVLDRLEQGSARKPVSPLASILSSISGLSSQG